MIITVHFAIDRRSLLTVVGPNYNWWAVQYGRFLPRDAMLSAVSRRRVSIRLHALCVCVSVTFRYCITRNSAIAEGPREALVGRNPATTKYLT